MPDTLTQGARNILGMYYRASADERIDGATWYARAHQVARDLAQVNGYTVPVAAAVLAALSPNNRWGTNVRDAEACMQAHAAGLPVESVRVSTYRKNLAKAWAVLSGEIRPADAFNERTGPKTLAFFRLIADPADSSVCVDGHAFAIWSGERLAIRDARVTPAQFRAVAGDYVAAARVLGLAPHVVQATTWTVYRRIHARAMRNAGRGDHSA